MPIFPSDAPDPDRTPGGDVPLIVASIVRPGVYALTLRPGADAREIAELLACMPVDAFLTEHVGDIDLTMVFRTVPDGREPDPTGGVTPTAPAAARGTRP
ncbi:hypothetical protein ThrDRAFT_02021 [Frankia casuarinae]|jgi:uncharacterized repeat protein (TIGR03917 family)|uniref:Uncharacterized protein n=1 Tax=Frankia casuarinae (strain DSM 45818 / CECT 9043 / HFP020203 / CcI3) TaxID=106370 RepID=Q2JFZ9_FRACC|nr:hypothetical protein [Frankia casuarinae]ABD09793.1 hypothetical protein Francci3_0406 [Frankia casuarinae]EYT92242.1 hypothetical protein ThrDRAFT_02021 [Frankia casuarinae]